MYMKMIYDMLRLILIKQIFCFYYRDCIDGVGFEVLHKAFKILSNIEDDEVEVCSLSIYSNKIKYREPELKKTTIK